MSTVSATLGEGSLPKEDVAGRTKVGVAVLSKVIISLLRLPKLPLLHLHPVYLRLMMDSILQVGLK